MSATTTAVIVPAAAPPQTPKDKITDAAIKASHDLPGLVATLEVVNPTLAKQIAGKAAVASTTIWGHVALLLVGAVVAKYGINWDSTLQVEVAGCVVLGAQAAWGIANRFITSSPITSLFKKPVPAPTEIPKPVISVAPAAPITTTGTTTP